MSWKSCMGAARAPLLMLAMMCFLAACQSSPATRIAATDAAVAADVCSVWRPVTYSSSDTDQTRREARANNAARLAYGCQQ